MTKLRRFLARDDVKGAGFLLGAACGGVVVATDPRTLLWRVALGLGAFLGGLGIVSGGSSKYQPPKVDP